MTFLTSQQAYGKTTGSTPTGAPVIMSRNPTPNDVQYPIGQQWINTTGQNNYYLNDQTSVAGNLQSNWVLYGAGTSPLATLTGNTGGAISPTGNNINTVGVGSINIVGSGSTLTTQLTGLTNHAVLVGAGTTTITKVGPTATAGQVLQSAGAAADPVFSTATYPSTTTGNDILYSSSTNVVGQITTANDGVLITSNAGVPSWLANGTAGQVLTANTAAPPSWQTNDSGFSSATWTVSPISGQGNFTTIAAAIAAASSGDDILIRTGTYTENPTLKAGVNLVAWDANGQTPLVKIVGNTTFTAEGTVSLSGICLQTNEGYALSITGAAASIVNCTNCFFNATNHHAIVFNSSSPSASLNIYQCNGLGSVNNSLFESIAVSNTPGTINFVGMNFLDGGFSYELALTSAVVNVDNSYIEASFHVGTAFNMVNSVINTTNQLSANSQVRLTSGTGVIENSVLIGPLSGSVAPCILVTDGTCTCANSTLTSGDSVAVNNGDTFNYAGLTFTDSSSFTNTGTLNLLDTSPSNAASGYVWTSTGTTTSPTWQPASGGGGGGFQSADYIVDQTPGEGDYTTVGGAVAVATNGQTILVRSGTYVEDLKIDNNIVIVAEGPSWDVEGVSSPCVIVGHTTITTMGSGYFYAQGIQFRTNGNYALDFQPNSEGPRVFTNCSIIANDNIAVNFADNGGAQVFFEGCYFDMPNGFAYYVQDGGSLMQFDDCKMYNTSSSGSGSDAATGSVIFNNTQVAGALTSSGAFIGFYNSLIDVSTLGVDAISLTDADGGTAEVANSTISTGGNSGMFIGDASSARVTLTNIKSTNPYVIEGSTGGQLAAGGNFSEAGAIDTTLTVARLNQYP